MAHLQEWFYDTWLASDMMKHMTMAYYDNGDDGGDEDRNKHGNDNHNAASG